MTSEEAIQKIISCESNIKSAYNGLWSAAKEVGITGCDAALREKNRIENAALGDTIRRVVVSSLPLQLFGIILCIMSLSYMGVFIVIVGIIVAYNVYKSADKEADRRIGAANSTLIEVSNRQLQLNSTLDSNKTI